MINIFFFYRNYNQISLSYLNDKPSTSFHPKLYSFSYKYYKLKIYLKFLILIHLSKILLFTLFLLILLQKNAVGLLYLSFLLLILVIEKEVRWLTAWIPIFFSTMIIMMCQYLLQLSIFDNFIPDMMGWIGFSSDNKNNNYSFFLIHSFIMGMCVLQRNSQNWRNLARNRDQIKNFKVLKEKYSDYGLKSYNSENSSHEILKEIEEEKENKEEIYKEFLAEYPIIQINSLQNKLDKLYMRLGYEMTLFMLVFCAFYKINIMSIFYLLIATYLSFHSKYLLLNDHFWKKKVSQNYIYYISFITFIYKGYKTANNLEASLHPYFPQSPLPIYHPTMVSSQLEHLLPLEGFLLPLRPRLQKHFQSEREFQ